MKTKSYSFIDLTKLGRTNWWVPVLTLLVIALISILSTLTVLAFTGWSVYLSHFSAAAQIKGLLTSGGTLIGALGFWVSCKYVMRRPFRSLISVDLTFSVRRCLFGAALFLPVNLIALMAMTLYASARYGAWIIPLGHLRLPNSGQIFAAAAAIIAIPFFAFSEELFFRGWLTQALRQYVRIRLVVVTVVALAFAVYHTQYDLHMKAVVFVSSFGLSALSLRDQGLELAVGAHAMLNICAALEMLFFSGGWHTQTSAPVTTFDWFALAAIRSGLPFALMYWFLTKTNGWFARNPTTEVADVQPA
ncbi:CPBP family glutamic-type intramembrane protease [Paraburkholderia tropica]|uniref:CPBP family glutamic-type intramembrane protease n=1 Tax=Paraburkholderia tropica TaxID=92647 RepID=UPI0016136878|nr:CPBP family glutamic-type intramembrane protease [Paraburkholderia tropica]MBB2984568.1 membrane protease YdiL (CAAX protease family) [Paraburkholderia tropica]